MTSSVVMPFATQRYIDLSNFPMKFTADSLFSVFMDCIIAVPSAFVNENVVYCFPKKEARRMQIDERKVTVGEEYETEAMRADPIMPWAGFV